VYFVGSLEVGSFENARNCSCTFTGMCKPCPELRIRDYMTFKCMTCVSIINADDGGWVCQNV